MVTRVLFLVICKIFLVSSCLCPSIYLGNGHCDSACDNAACNYDQGDCDKGGSSSSDSKSIIATIVGVVVGIFVVFWVVIGCTIYCKYRQKKKIQMESYQNDAEASSVRASDVESSKLLTKDVIQRICPLENYYIGIPIDGEPVCNLCMTDFKIGDWIRRTHCMHSFHAKCLDEWLLYKNLNPKCPTCDMLFLR
ncbi:RNF11 [Blepharisma stoltei]|uniref:RING-type domain-containing protein n=1 Tax=Blepharisma stoltei TaxID=1481888 RepID=A0AAU9JSA4_9CILI|nr:unnamed protein product [Blepharisma stoltei]